MQKKENKGSQKRRLDEATEENLGKNEKQKKKAKISSEAKENSNNISVDGKEKSTKKLDTTIFQFFTDLTHDDEEIRLKAALQLVQQINKTKETEKRQKEFSYTLKRLIRGCGAATNASRSGFFTGLIAFLKTYSNEDDLAIGSIFDIMQKELHVGSTIANKEDADAVVGKILVCGALMRAGRIQELSSEHLERITNILLQAIQQRSYHTSLGYAFLIEMIESSLSEEQFESAVWPSLLKELTKPWPKQTLQSIHCVIILLRKFPSLVTSKFLKTHFGGRQLLNAESYGHLYRVFWEHTDTHIITHPAFEIFGSYLAECENLAEFWRETVDAGIKTPTKISEYLTLKVATDILQNLNPANGASVVVELLSPNFIKMLVNGLKQIKIKKDETLKAFYEEYMDALLALCVKLPPSADNQKVEVIRRLILYPGSFDIEKYTKTRVIHQLINTLGPQGIKETFLLYKQIFCGVVQKKVEENTTEWVHFERMNAGFMLQNLLTHKVTQQHQELSEWRLQQLRFLLICGVFNVQQSNKLKDGDVSYEPCKKTEACSFNKDFGEQCKNMFYASLQGKFSDLKQERKLLLDLVLYCDQYVEKNTFNSWLRVESKDENRKTLQKSWKKVFNAVNKDEQLSKSEKKVKKQKIDPNTGDENKLQLVFHILILNMGLQLFREPEMAAPAVEDLLKCMEKTQQKQQNKKKTEADEEETPEPEWIEVVIDLFLHLLSQSSGALRNSVNNLFPHLCKNLNVNALHQILAMLDMKDGQNPLSRKGDDDSDDDEAEEDDKDSDGSENEDSEDSEAENGADDDDDEDEDNDDEEEEEEEDDDDINANDKLRNAISQALIANGGAGGDGNDDDDDMASIDLNDMTEEEGRRLDEALASAFKTMKKPSSQGSKKTKSQRMEATAVMHFRIRVLDLLEIYLQHPEANLLNNIEIMLALYNMLEYCFTDELKPLQSKIEKVIQKLTTIKHSSAVQTTKNVDSEGLSAEDIVNYMRQIIDKKTSTLAFDLTNRIRNRCIIYLITYASTVPKGDDRVLELCAEYQAEFIASRNPVVNITLLSEIYKLRWLHIWQLAAKLALNGLSMETRAFRRIQVCEILSVLYKNNELQKLNATTTEKQFKNIEKALITYIEGLSAVWSQPQARQSHKEFQTLLELLLQVKRTHARLQTQASLACSEEACEKIQELRRCIHLESTHIYQRYCGAFKLNVIRNTEVAEKIPSEQLPSEESQKNKEGNKKSGKKNKKENRSNGNEDTRKQKKQKKMERLLAASKGLNGGFEFQKAVEENNGHDSDESA